MAHDLEPVHDGLDGGERIEMCVRRDLLRGGNVVVAPAKEPPNRRVDDLRVDRGVQEVSPRDCRGQDGLPAE